MEKFLRPRNDNSLLICDPLESINIPYFILFIIVYLYFLLKTLDLHKFFFNIYLRKILTFLNLQTKENINIFFSLNKLCQLNIFLFFDSSLISFYKLRFMNF